jgi:hypothetical protein
MTLRIALLFFLVSGGMFSWPGQPASPAGTWHGVSTCLTDAPACQDEQVVYYIQPIPAHPDQLYLRADKIVDAGTVTIGSGPWSYDRKQQTLSLASSGQVWLLSIDGNRIEGSLTLDGKVVFRRMTLTHDRPEPQRFR